MCIRDRYYDTSAIGRFPERLAPISHRPHLTDLKGAISYNEIFEQLTRLNLDIYRPTPVSYTHLWANVNA